MALDNAYRTLGLLQPVTQAEVDAAYRRMTALFADHRSQSAHLSLTAGNHIGS